MPVEIKELIIKATVDNSESYEGGILSKTSNEMMQILPKLKEEIIEECMAKIMEYLAKNTDR